MFKVNFSIHHFLIIIVLILFSACITPKKISYVRDNTKAGETVSYKQSSTTYKIQPTDQLYLKVISLDEATTNLFNAESKMLSSNYNDIKLFLNSYMVSDSGTIDIPVVGKINVLGLTIKEAKDKILSELNQYLNQVTVIVKLTSFKVTILGEVNRPGKFVVYNEESSIFEAIGQAGDLTDYGNRRKVKLIRKTSSGSEVTILDLTDKSLFTSEYYYLHPHDIIYVEPLRAKSFGARSFTIGTVLSALTTLILILNYTSK